MLEFWVQFDQITQSASLIGNIAAGHNGWQLF